MTASLSVVVPCYNAEAFVVSALRSIVAQQHPGPLELIVVDDGSTDASVARVRAAFPAATVLQQPNRGVAAARNVGIAHARGDWIAFLDADDLWLPGKLAAQWQALAATPGARMAYSAWQEWHSDSPDADAATLAALAAGDAARWAGPSGWIYPDLLLDCVVWTSTVLAERSLFDAVGSFDPGLPIGEDWDLWLRAARVTPIVRVARPGGLYRMHPVGLTRRAPDANYKDIVISRAVQRWGYAGPDGRSADPAAVARVLADSWSRYAGAQLGAGRLSRARQASWRGLRGGAFGQPRAWRVVAEAYTRSILAGWPLKT